MLGVAGRVEHYSDFGSTSTGKVAARFSVVKGFALRGAVSTGFRAPSLGQEFFSSTATNFIAGVPFDIRTFPVEHGRGAACSARSDLEPERSVNLSAGVAVEPARGLAFTADFYRIKINKRIVLSDNFTGAAIQTLFTNAGLDGVSGGRFFSNAIDTRSNGVDLVANYDVTLRARSVLRLTSRLQSQHREGDARRLDAGEARRVPGESVRPRRANAHREAAIRATTSSCRRTTSLGGVRPHGANAAVRRSESRRRDADERDGNARPDVRREVDH